MTRRSSRANRDEAERHAPVVVGLGMADVEGGVLSLYPTVPGRVTEVPVAENAVVRSGAVLLRLDDEAARAQVGEAEAALEAAEAQLAEGRKRRGNTSSWSTSRRRRRRRPARAGRRPSHGLAQGGSGQE